MAARLVRAYAELRRLQELLASLAGALAAPGCPAAAARVVGNAEVAGAVRQARPAAQRRAAPGRAQASDSGLRKLVSALLLNCARAEFAGLARQRRAPTRALCSPARRHAAWRSGRAGPQASMTPGPAPPSKPAPVPQAVHGLPPGQAPALVRWVAGWLPRLGGAARAPALGGLLAACLEAGRVELTTAAPVAAAVRALLQVGRKQRCRAMHRTKL